MKDFLFLLFHPTYFVRFWWYGDNGGFPVEKSCYCDSKGLRKFLSPNRLISLSLYKRVWRRKEGGLDV